MTDFGNWMYVVVIAAFAVMAVVVLLQARHINALTAFVVESGRNPVLAEALRALAASVPPDITKAALAVLDGLEVVTGPDGDALLNALEELLRRAADDVKTESALGGPDPDARPDAARS